MTPLAIAFGVALMLSISRPSNAAGPVSNAGSTDVTPGKRDAVTVSLQNLVAECVQLDLGTIRTERNVTLVAGQLQIAGSIGDCGCKSAVLSYRTVRQIRGRDIELARGQLNTLRLGKGSAAVYLVVATDHVAPIMNVSMVLACENSQ